MLMLAVLTCIPSLVSTDVMAITRTSDAQEILHSSAQAIQRAGSLHYELEMHMTTIPVRGNSGTAESLMTGEYVSPDRLQGALTIINPWSETHSRIIVADGLAYASNPQTGDWETELKRATTYYPVILTGCLIRMARADTHELLSTGVEVLDGIPVHHLRGLGGKDGDVQLEYWIGVADRLPRRASVVTEARPGWSDEMHTYRIAATLHLSDYGTQVTIHAPEAHTP
jgi:hypothetical protein